MQATGKVTLTGFGGVGEIGGNAFLLEAGSSRLLLDFGKRFGSDRRVEDAGIQPGWNDYFDDYLKPRTFRFLQDLVGLGVLPDLPGAYRTDLGGGSGAPALAGVVVSHAHMDHAGMLGLLRPDIPVLASAQSQAILGSMQETGISAPETDFLGTKARGRVGLLKDGTPSGKAAFPPGPRRAWETSATADADAWKVRHLPVDHSIPGAQATIVEGPVSLCYTGDFRLHGRSGHLSEKLVERAGGVDVLVAEGTNIHAAGHDHHKQTDKETTVEATLDELLHREAGRTDRTGFVAVSYPPRDLDRFQSILSVAKRHGRRFAISAKQAHLLDSLRQAGRDDLPDPRSDPAVAVYFEAAGKGLLLESPEAVPVAAANLAVAPMDCRADGLYDRLLESDYPAWARPYLGCRNAIGPLDVRRDPSAFLFSISYWSITELFDIFPDRARANGLYIHSQTQPFNDEMLQDRRKLDRWLRAYNLDFAQTHVSGHLDAESLEWVLDAVGARTLVPIHSQAPGVTAERYRARSGHDALLLQWGKAAPLL